MRSRTHEFKMFRRLIQAGCLSAMLWGMGCDDVDASATCDNYCEQSLSTCTGTNAQYSNESECLSACALMSTQGEDGDKDGDTLQCRMYHLGVARETDPTLHCPHSGESGAETCVDKVSQCDRYCGLIDEQCGDVAPQYGSVELCLMECEANFRQALESTGNTVQCRVDTLLEVNDELTLGQRCQGAGEVGVSTCVDATGEQ